MCSHRTPETTLRAYETLASSIRTFGEKLTSDTSGFLVARGEVGKRWNWSAAGALLLALALVGVDHLRVAAVAGKAVFTSATVVAAIPVYQRIRRFPARRITWSMLLAAELITAIAGALYGALPGGTNPFAPPTENLVMAALISVLAVGFATSLSYASLRVLDLSMLIDAVAGGLAISSLLAWLYIRRIITPFTGLEAGLREPTRFAIGVTGVIIVVAFVTASTMLDVTGDRLMLYTVSAAVLVSFGEVVAHHTQRIHASQWGSFIDICWIGAYVALGRAAQLDDGATSRRGERRERAFADHQSRKIAVFGVIAIAVMSLAAAFGDPPIVGGLALSALTVLMIRLLVSLRSERVHSTLYEELAVTDPLTGLANRRGFTAATMTSALTSGAADGGVVLIDLDNFKDVNDSLGHRAGDQVLRQLALRLKSSLDPSTTLARLGGDEFALSRSSGTVDDLEELAQNVALLVREPVQVEGLSLHLSASVGVAARSADHESQEELLRKADVAMYRAKENHSGVKVYDFEHDRNDPSRLVLYGKVGEAVRDGSIDVHLQPLIDIQTGRIAGCEALARWSPDGFDPIPPDRFVPMIEMQGLIVPFTAHVLRRSLEYVTQLPTLGTSHRLSVNVTERDFVNADLSQVVDAALSDFGFPAESLTIEITESVLANDDARIDQSIQDLRSMGIHIAIDDFGTGYSSLSKLVDFPIDELKIDRSFVSRVLTNRNAVAVVRAAIDLALEMGLVTVAEGVEDQETCDAIESLGVNLVQGYHLAPPMPASECEHFFSRFEWRPMARDQQRSQRNIAP